MDPLDPYAKVRRSERNKSGATAKSPKQIKFLEELPEEGDPMSKIKDPRLLKRVSKFLEDVRGDPVNLNVVDNVVEATTAKNSQTGSLPALPSIASLPRIPRKTSAIPAVTDNMGKANTSPAEADDWDSPPAQKSFTQCVKPTTAGQGNPRCNITPLEQAPKSSIGSAVEDDWDMSPPKQVESNIGNKPQPAKATWTASASEDWGDSHSKPPVVPIRPAPNAPTSAGQDDWDKSENPQTPMSSQPKSTKAAAGSNDDWASPKGISVSVGMTRDVTKPKPSIQAQASSVGTDDWDSPGLPTPKSTPVDKSKTPAINWGDDWDTSATPAQPVSRSPIKPASSSVASGWGDDWGDGGAGTKPAATSSTLDWGTPSTESVSKGSDDWGAPSSNDWGAPSSFGGGGGFRGRGGGGDRGRGRGRGGGRGNGRGGGRGGGRGDGQRNREGDWICGEAGCGVNNFSHRFQCFKCQASKPGESGGGGGGGTQNDWNTGSWNDSRKNSGFNANTEPLGDWSSRGNNGSSTLTAMTSFADSWNTTPANKPSSVCSTPSNGPNDQPTGIKHAKSKKRKRYSSSSSLSSSSSSSSGCSSKKSKKRRKHKHKKKRSHGHKHRDYLEAPMPLMPDYHLRRGTPEPFRYNTNAPTRKYSDMRFEIKASQIDATTQTPRFPDLDDTLPINIMEAFETALPLSYRFSAISQKEGGGPGVLGTLIQSTTVSTAGKSETNTIRKVKSLEGLSVAAPKTRGMVTAQWPMYQISLDFHKSTDEKPPSVGDNKGNVKNTRRAVKIPVLPPPVSTDNAIPMDVQTSGGESGPTVCEESMINCGNAVKAENCPDITPNVKHEAAEEENVSVDADKQTKDNDGKDEQESVGCSKTTEDITPPNEDGRDQQLDGGSGSQLQLTMDEGKVVSIVEEEW